MKFEEVQALLVDEKCYAKENFVPIIREKSAKFLYDFVQENCIKDVLEIGTAIGYSGSIILSAGAENLTTVDINKDYFELAKQTFRKLNFDNKVQMHLMDAKDLLNTLISDDCKYDMIFLDGAKGQYINYLPKLKILLKSGGFIFADNVLLGGMVESEDRIPHRKRTMVVNLRKYLEAIKDEDCESKLYKIEDGIAITKVKGD